MATILENLAQSGPLLKGAVGRGHIRVLRSMLGPAFRGLIQQRGRNEAATSMDLGYSAMFDWRYQRTEPQLARLYEAGKVAQWNGTTDLDWSISVDPDDPEKPIVPDSFMPLARYPGFQRLDAREKARQRHLILAWMLSQFLHGEQGALFAACQVTEAVPWLDAKLYGSTQAVDEGRHIETFHRYLTEKLGKLYEINDNLRPGCSGTRTGAPRPS